MNYYQKYLKYKIKYLNLKTQFGGQYRIITDGSREIILESRHDAVKLEIKINKLQTSVISKERLKELGDLLYYEDRNYQKNISVTSLEMNILLELLNLSNNPNNNTTNINKPTFKPPHKKLDSEEKKELNNISIDDLLELLGLNIGYLSSNPEWTEERIEFIRKYFSDKGIEMTFEQVLAIFNKEKGISIKSKNDLEKKLRKSDIKLILDTDYKPSSFEGRSDMGTYTDDDGKTYIYKKLSTLYKNLELTDFSQELLKCYGFIDGCQSAYFLKKEGDVSIEFVKIQKKLIISEDDNGNISIGYLMEKVEGITVRDFKKDNEDEYFATIYPAILDLIDELTAKGFLIQDFALDNIMFNPKTKKLTYIDISPHSFERDLSEVHSQNPLVKAMNWY